MTQYARNEAGQRFEVGTRVVLDNRVHGAVDGFYQDQIGQQNVIFRSDYKMGKYVYGVMPLAKEPDHPGNEELNLKFFSFTLILVHPSNLKLEEPA